MVAENPNTQCDPLAGWDVYPGIRGDFNSQEDFPFGALATVAAACQAPNCKGFAYVSLSQLGVTYSSVTSTTWDAEACLYVPAGDPAPPIPSCVDEDQTFEPTGICSNTFPDDYRSAYLDCDGDGATDIVYYCRSTGYRGVILTSRVRQGLG